MSSSFDYQFMQYGRLYRSPAEIKEDIDGVASRLEEINSMLNVRNIMSEYGLSGEGDIKDRARAMLELCESADEVLDELRELNTSLNSLIEELVWTIENTNL